MSRESYLFLNKCLRPRSALIISSIIDCSLIILVTIAELLPAWIMIITVVASPAKHKSAYEGLRETSINWNGRVLLLRGGLLGITAAKGNWIQSVGRGWCILLSWMVLVKIVMIVWGCMHCGNVIIGWIIHGWQLGSLIEEGSTVR